MSQRRIAPDLLRFCLFAILCAALVPVAFAQDYSNNLGASPQQMLQGVDPQSVRQLNAASTTLQRNPNDVNALVTRAALSLNIADKSRYSMSWVHFAAKDLEKALTLDPNNFYAQHNYAMACYETGDINDAQPVMHLAVTHFNRAIQLEPDSARSYMGRGWAYLMMDDSVHANADFQKALQLDPSLRNQLTSQANAIRDKRAQKGCFTHKGPCVPPPNAPDYRYSQRAGGYVVR